MKVWSGGVEAYKDWPEPLPELSKGLTSVEIWQELRSLTLFCKPIKILYLQDKAVMNLCWCRSWLMSC